MSAFALEDGTVFAGESVGAEGVAFGEAVFTTAMTGYQETVTDPSFAEQPVCFTAPMVGNYGVAPGRAESTGVHAKAVLMREARGPEWTTWLADEGIVALTGLDTRSRSRSTCASGRYARRRDDHAHRGRGAGGGARDRRCRARPSSTGVDSRAVCLLRRGLGPGRRRRLRSVSARFCAGSPEQART